MKSNTIPPNSGERESSRVPTPIVYESDEEYRWEYKHVERHLVDDSPLAEDLLNQLGKENWEMVSVFRYKNTAHYYFKRLKM